MSGKTVCIFCGQESRYLQMGRELFDRNERFRQSMHELDALAPLLGGRPVSAALHVNEPVRSGRLMPGAAALG